MKYTGYGFYIQLHTLCMFAYGEVVGMRPQRHAFILIPKDAPESGSLIREERSGGTVMSKRQQPRKRPKKPKTDKKQRERLGFSLALAPGTSPAGVPILGGGRRERALAPHCPFPLQQRPALSRALLPVPIASLPPSTPAAPRH